MTASWLRVRGVPSAIGWAASGVQGSVHPSTPLRANGAVTATKSWVAQPFNSAQGERDCDGVEILAGS